MDFRAKIIVLKSHEISDFWLYINKADCDILNLTTIEATQLTMTQSTVDRLNIWYRRVQQFAAKAEKRLKKRQPIEVML